MATSSSSSSSQVGLFLLFTVSVGLFMAVPQQFSSAMECFVYDIPDAVNSSHGDDGLKLSKLMNLPRTFPGIGVPFSPNGGPTGQCPAARAGVTNYCLTYHCTLDRLDNPRANRWSEFSTESRISPDGLQVSNNRNEWIYAFAEQGFLNSGEYFRRDNFKGKIVYYFEVTQTFAAKDGFRVGLSSEKVPNNSQLGQQQNSYAISRINECFYLSGKKHNFATKPDWNGPGDVIGCGLQLNANNKVAIFFTFNGILLGKPIQISHPGHRLYPAIDMKATSFEANFGDNSTRPFKFDWGKICE